MTLAYASIHEIGNFQNLRRETVNDEPSHLYGTHWIHPRRYGDGWVRYGEYFYYTERIVHIGFTSICFIVQTEDPRTDIAECFQKFIMNATPNTIRGLTNRAPTQLAAFGMAKPPQPPSTERPQTTPSTPQAYQPEATRNGQSPYLHAMGNTQTHRQRGPRAQLWPNGYVA